MGRLLDFMPANPVKIGLGIPRLLILKLTLIGVDY
jgi:hypothetical protein